MEGGFDGQLATRASLMSDANKAYGVGAGSRGAADPFDMTSAEPAPTTPTEAKVDRADMADDKASEVTTGQMQLAEGRMGKSGGWRGDVGGAANFGFAPGGDVHGYGGYANISRRSQQRYYGWAGPMVAQRLTYGADPAYDDLTEMIPALLPGEDDAWRKLLGHAASTPNPIDDAAAALLAKARNCAVGHLPVGRARARRRRRAPDRLASHDDGGPRRGRGPHAVGVDAPLCRVPRRRRDARAVAADDIAVAPRVPAGGSSSRRTHAVAVTVRARGAHQVALSRTIKSKDELAFVLSFDDRARLVSVTDKTGRELIAVTWG